MMKKYDRLHDYLEDAESDTVTLSFSDVERIIKSRLPKSARKYNAWWQWDGSRSQDLAWRKAGFRVTDVDLERELVVFSRVK